MTKFYQLANHFKKRTKDTRAIKTGEFRNPIKGEWYLSGAIGEAYQAPNDLSYPHYIAQIIETKQIRIRVITGDNK